MKQCSKCSTLKPLSEYNADRSKSDGRYPSCKMCSRKTCRATFAKNREGHLAAKRRWKDANRARHRAQSLAWAKGNPEAAAQRSARYRERLKLATPAWVDLAALVAIKKSCPKGWHVDHIHPLSGDGFCGLNVPWNVHVVPAEVNFKKSTKLLPAYGLHAQDGGYSNL